LPAPKALAAVEDTAAPIAAWTLKPAPRPAERCRRTQVLNQLLDVLPRARRGMNSKRQLKAVRKGKEAYGADR
jgi:hypothetical protein